MTMRTDDMISQSAAMVDPTPTKSTRVPRIQIVLPNKGSNGEKAPAVADGKEINSRIDTCDAPVNGRCPLVHDTSHLTTQTSLQALKNRTLDFKINEECKQLRLVSKFTTDEHCH